MNKDITLEEYTNKFNRIFADKEEKGFSQEVLRPLWQSLQNDDMDITFDDEIYQDYKDIKECEKYIELLKEGKLKTYSLEEAKKITDKEVKQMSLDLINQANLLIEKTMNSTLKDNLRNIFDDESSLSYNEFINTVNIIYSKNLITKSSRNRLLRINEKKKAKGEFNIKVTPKGARLVSLDNYDETQYNYNDE